MTTMMISTVTLPPSLSFFFKPQPAKLTTTLFLSRVHHTCLPLVLRAQKSPRFGVKSVRRNREGGNKLLHVADSDSDEDDVDGGDEDLELGFNGEDEEEDEDGMVVPFGEMKKWLEKKPRGFGEGKVYDTPIEDKLLQELEAEATAAVVVETEAVKAKAKSKPKKKGDEVVVPAGFRVRVTNLPKKKNVHRDLSAAFKTVPGLLSINPAVSGNKKTKDPVCKGFGFVHFKTEKDAARFVETFSSQSITFGKVQKQIKCEVVTSAGSDVEQPKSAHRPAGPRLSALEPVTVNYTVLGPKLTTAPAPAPKTSSNKSTDSQLTVSTVGDESKDSDLDGSSLDKLEEIVSAEYEGSDVEFLEPEVGDFMENLRKSGDFLDAQLTAALGDQEVDSDFSDLDDVILDTLDESVSDDEYDGPDVVILRPEEEELKDTLQTSTVSNPNGGDDGIIELATDSEPLADLSASKKSAPRKKRAVKLKGGDEIIELATEPEPLADLSSSKESVIKSKEEKVPRKKQAVKPKGEGAPKKLTAKEKAPKAPKVPKSVIPGSAKRLKVKEKAVLIDVFSKYGMNPALASNEE